MAEDISQVEQDLQEDMGRFYADPLGFVMYAFDWDSPELKHFGGPDTWQRDLMESVRGKVLKNDFDGHNPVDAVMEAVASGHGIGKSAITAWIILWIMSTRPNAKGTVTANTSDQLRTKTWGELGKWHKRCITGHWFQYNNTKGNMNLYHKTDKETWRCDAVTCKEENSESFAGQHSADGSPFYIFDEASAVPNIIWEVAEGGTTDGEPFWFVFGNPTRNDGRFRECWRKFRKRWTTHKIDSRTSKITNKNRINGWIEDYGIDSDFVKVRVLGEFPSQSEDQYISEEVLRLAQTRPMPDDKASPLILGIDFGRSGTDPTVIRGRRGRDARSFKKLEFRERDSMVLADKIGFRLAEMYEDPVNCPDAIFADGGGLGGPIIDRLNQLGHNVIEVNSASKAEDDDHNSNKRAEMAARNKMWLLKGGCIDDSELLFEDLAIDEARLDNKDRLLMMSKDDIKLKIGRSPDDGDAHKLTFAHKVNPKVSHLDKHMNMRAATYKVSTGGNLGFREGGRNSIRTS